jgi:hypothetical protein
VYVCKDHVSGTPTAVHNQLVAYPVPSLNVRAVVQQKFDNVQKSVHGGTMKCGLKLHLPVTRAQGKQMRAYAYPRENHHRHYFVRPINYRPGQQELLNDGIETLVRCNSQRVLSVILDSHQHETQRCTTKTLAKGTEGRTHVVGVVHIQAQPQQGLKSAKMAPLARLHQQILTSLQPPQRHSELMPGAPRKTYLQHRVDVRSKPYEFFDRLRPTHLGCSK